MSAPGRRTKVANQIIVALTIEAVGEALLFASKAGADPAKVRQALMGGFASSRILEVHGERMIKRTFDPGFRIELHQKDLSLALAGRAGAEPVACRTPRRRRNCSTPRPRSAARAGTIPGWSGCSNTSPGTRSPRSRRGASQGVSPRGAMLDRVRDDGHSPRSAHGAVAQLGERRVRNAKVRGSIPLGSTIPRTIHRSNFMPLSGG